MKFWNQNTDIMSSDQIAQKLSEIKDPEYLHQQRIAYQRKKYEELLNKISFLDAHLRQEDRKYDYTDDFKPFVFFFKFLARRPDVDNPPNATRLKLWLPDTVLTSDGDNPPMWLYTSPDGYVHRTDNFSAKNIINKMGSFSSPDELVAVLKKPQAKDFSYVGNDIRLLTLKDLSLIAQSVVSSRGDIICIQRFIKSVGPKAFICRTCWRKDKNPYVWVITNNKDFFRDDENIPENQRFITNPRIMNSCTIINSIRGRYVEETTPYVINLVKYLENNIPGAKFQEFVADFIKDESGTWWLVNIRSFILVDKLSVNPRLFLAGPDDPDYYPIQIKKKKPEGYQKVTMCKYCEMLYPVEELLHKMTLKSIIQTDKHLMHRGKSFKWLERSDIKQIDTTSLYQEHKVCKSCYKLHQETEKLRQVEFEFAKALGIPVNPDKRPDLVSATTFPSATHLSESLSLAGNQTHRSNAPINFGHEESDKTELKFNSSGIMSNSAYSPKANQNQYMKRFRLMVYLHMVYDIPKDINANNQYYIEYCILDQRQRYKVDLSSAFSINGDILIPINKLRVFFLFSFDRKGINEYINEQKALTLNLYCENEKVGTVSFELNDFLSDKVIKREMFKVFSGKKLPILSWGLKITVGLIEGGLEDINRIKLNEHKHIYLTSPDYYTCEALPEEWLQVFEETQHHVSQLLSRSEIKSSRYSISMSQNDSARRRHSKKPMISFNAPGNPGLAKVKSDPYDLISTQRDYTSPPPKSLFNDEKSISNTNTDDGDESLEVVRKILLDSIRDYEKGGIQHNRKVSAKSDKQKKDIHDKSTAKTSARGPSRGMSAGLNSNR